MEPYQDHACWWLAYSGGLDSTVLLALLAQMRTEGRVIPPIKALHINHGLSTNADNWQTHCQQQCETLDIPFEVVTVTVDRHSGKGLEAAARQARYQAFEKQLGEGELLLMAHHLDDQLETFFLRLLRGSGIEGLVAMPAIRKLGRGQLQRPLLGYSREELEHIADELKLSWIEDESNQNTDFDRNYLRHTVLPLLEKRWPAYRQSLSQSIAHLSESKSLLSDFNTSLSSSAPAVSRRGEPMLALNKLLSQDQLSLNIRLWLQAQHVLLPRREQLWEFIAQLSNSAQDTQPELLGQGYIIRRFEQIALPVSAHSRF